MFNREIEISEDNIDILFANALIENLRYGIISLNIMFKKQISEEFFNDEHTFYFFYMQSVLTAQGNIWNILFNNYFEKKSVSLQHREILKSRFGIDINDYPLVGNKKFRNTNEHFDERYYKFRSGLGDYNLLHEKTDKNIRESILESKPHLRTIDIQNWLYYSYDRQQNRICLDLRRLREEMYCLLQKLCIYDIRIN